MICPECGALLVEGAGRCSHCGHPVPASHTPQVPAHPRPTAPALTPEERAFEGRLYAFPWVTAALSVVCVLVWLAMELQVGSEDPALLVIFGGRQSSLVKGGEWWRLVSASFLHIGWKHLLFNGVALAQLGLFCENIFGRGRYLLLFVLTGMGGFLLGSLFSDSVSAGASASLFGLMGAMLVFGWRHRREIPPFFQRLFTWTLLPWVVLNLALGMVFANLDNLAHFGGLITGIAVAWILDNRILTADHPPGVGRRGHGWGAGLAGLGLMAIAGVKVWQDVATLLPVRQDLQAAAQAGDLDGVRRAWTGLIDAKPSVGLFYASRAEAEAQAGRAQEAEADLRAALALRHSPAGTMNQLAWLLTTRDPVTRRDVDEAVRLARQSVAQRRGADNLNTLGWALYLKGDLRASRAQLELALVEAQDGGLLGAIWTQILEVLGRPEGEVAAFDLYMLAMVSAGLGEEDVARRYLARAELAAANLRGALGGVADPLAALAAEDELATLDDIAARAHALIEGTDPGAPGRPGSPI